VVVLSCVSPLLGRTSTHDFDFCPCHRFFFLELIAHVCGEEEDDDDDTWDVVVNAMDVHPITTVGSISIPIDTAG